ncbi:MAG: glycosyltransferase family 2 protein [Acidimicrobiia bacterium]|nr:glycosyltransferase family 2 protein [Acidimicrobiia bacterium]
MIMPAYDEAPNLAEVVPRTVAVLEAMATTYELVVVDDGSTDATPEVMADLAERHPGVRHLRLRRNCGKSAALQAGFERTEGEVVVLMDADGQDDPGEIPALLDTLGRGVDLVTGRRLVRNDRMIKRTTSKLYNRATSMVTGVVGRDFNSGLKAMTRRVVDGLELYGELHRYVPVLAAWAGFRVSEVDVAHHPRVHGATKFSHSRFWRGFLDLLTVKFLTTYTARPFHLFGGLGMATGALGSVLLVWMGISKLAGNAVGQRPALLIGVLLVVVGVQLMSRGLLAELVVHYRRPRSSDVLVEEVPRVGR